MSHSQPSLIPTLNDGTIAARLAAIVESSDDAIISKDLNGVITSWNGGAERVFGYTAEEAVGRPVTMLMPEDRVNEEPGILSRIRRGERVDHYETVRRRNDGALLDISLSVAPIYDSNGVIVGASKIARDITERKRAAAAEREAEVMHRLLEAQEAERNKIARDLHDHLGQRMTGLRLKLESLLDECRDQPHLEKMVRDVRRVASQIDQDIGFLSWELRPTEIEQLGLKGALGSFVREWSNQFGIPAEFHADSMDTSAPRLPALTETNLYRITQEALNNVVKHANAANVSVMMHRRPDEVVVIVEDDGRGLQNRSASKRGKRSRGLGLVGMKERAATLKGTLEIESRRGKGTAVIVRVPVLSVEPVVSARGA